MVGCGGVKTVDVSELVKRGGLMYERASGRPFTGVMAYEYPDGHMAYKNTYKDGKEDGLQTDWHETTGQKAYEAIYKDGKLMSETKWDEEGNEINE
jgi:antitoxin component YwqK of YwqJK toxin-antitoxin module